MIAGQAEGPPAYLSPHLLSFSSGFLAGYIVIPHLLLSSSPLYLSRSHQQVFRRYRKRHKFLVILLKFSILEEGGRGRTEPQFRTYGTQGREERGVLGKDDFAHADAAIPAHMVCLVFFYTKESYVCVDFTMLEV
jgi:hypothetical protein